MHLDDSQSMKTFLIIYLKVRYDEQIAITIVNYLVTSKNAEKETDVVFLRFTRFRQGTVTKTIENRCTMCNRVA